MSAAALDRQWIEAHLPHRGTMCLLDEIMQWDATTIRAIARPSRDSHPLRRDGKIPIAAGIEYGAQAAAAHGAAVSGAPTPGGFLAAVRGVEFHAPHLDESGGVLEIEAEQVGGGASGVIYGFRVSAGGTRLVEGRVTIAFIA